MTALAAILASLTAAAVFDMQAIPLQEDAGRVFLAQADPDGAADVFVLQGGRLTFCLTGRRNRDPGEITLAEDAGAFDIADVDADGRPEIIAVCGDRVMRYALPIGADPPGEPQELFRLETPFAGPGDAPYPHVLVVTLEGKTVLALPTATALELRGTDGALEAAYAYAAMQEGGLQAAQEARFTTCSVRPPQAAPPGAIEMLVDCAIHLEAGLPEPLLSRAPDASEGRRGTPSQLRDAAAVDPAMWPWFPLRPGTEGGARVLYALGQDTLICIRELIEEPGGMVRLSPVRRYPGAIVLPPDDLPDFNGDGAVDLLLWTAPVPGLSVDALARTVMSGTWPVQLSVRAFSPEKGRYDPAPGASLTSEVPARWFVLMESGTPLRNCVLRDFDGDGCTDCGFSPAPDRFAIWLHRDGFGTKPDEVHVFPEPILRLEFKADLRGQGRTSVGLRGARALYVLYAGARAPAPTP
ncbi:MAG: VCBS repeat-containing protein [Candidatus Hydrogenedentes bacterium]|nr:VCBS repeat-containing protein [Candidatus Hydrogenedentota bacterium]